MSDSMREPVRDWAAIAKEWAITLTWEVPSPLRGHLHEMASEIERLRALAAPRSDFAARTAQSIRRRRNEE